mmetsp:Transcript_162445/g.520653  ORF Transcript_162445/g.520653 Transcript_162445/m.520653 type:complete len:439 (-) Transcript_162445:77-1393(-)|eukprot:CAMPEP_0203887898 /NCGR_PEP_ID=MMETSP0359-20131031/31558_1 /ASSEMBLY_ACC=CAM_ASM_000338 /TAXON_ID=268821 /ORGANISM="Scrippsiella Hangoei, Strain SHTV-5" /LENGTH=438 /DNA_ID=CAMNT_0050809005 /DNA_START=68 /DNA_END=1384 /DNA_ORIENTATION=-
MLVQNIRCNGGLHASLVEKTMPMMGGPDQHRSRAQIPMACPERPLRPRHALAGFASEPLLQTLVLAGVAVRTCRFTRPLTQWRQCWGRNVRRARRAVAESSVAQVQEEPQNFRTCLARQGLAVVQVPDEALKMMQAAAESLCASSDDGLGQAQGVGPAALAAAARAPNFSCRGSVNENFPSTMSWHWAADAETRQLFLPAAEAVGAHLGSDFAFMAAHLIVASGGEVRDVESKFHLDFGEPDIPRETVATALLPLFPYSFPESEGNLEWYPWDTAAAVYEGRQPLPQPAVHCYRVGEGAVFDGKLAHRTQPFSGVAFQGRKRVLAALYFARVTEADTAERSVRFVLFSQGAPPLPPVRLGGQSEEDDMVKRIQLAAEGGDPRAQQLLAKMHLMGQGVVRSVTLAAGWLRKAAAHGGPESNDLLQASEELERDYRGLDT